MKLAPELLAILNAAAWDQKGKLCSWQSVTQALGLYPLPFGLKEMWITLLILTRHCEFTRLYDFPLCTNKSGISGCFSSVLF